MEDTAKLNCIEKNDIEEVEEITVNRDFVKNAIFEIAMDMFVLGENDRENFEDMELEYDVKCDALENVEFIMNLEDEFGIIIGDGESDNLVTFEDYIDLIWEKVKSDNDFATEKEK